jgi:anti-sigma factor RsiW
MRCCRVEPLLSKHVDGRLPSRRAAAVVAHLERCPVCRHSRDEFLALGTAARELPRTPAPPDVERRVAERWIAECAAGGSSERRRRRAGPPLRGGAQLASWMVRGAPALAGLLVILALALAGRGPGTDVRRLNSGSARQLRSSKVDLGARPGLRRFAARVTLAAPLPQPTRPALAVSHAVTPRDRQGDLAAPAEHSGRQARRWAGPPADPWEEIETRVRRAVRVRDDFIRIPFPRLASTSDRQLAAAVESYRREAAVVDARLVREVTLQQKATALSDLCDRVRSDTGIYLSAGPSVADEKVTILCEKLPLREVMRQLSRPFGYAWLRSGKAPEYRYELVQDLRSQLLEEELRNRDRNEALLALEREIDRYRPLLGLSPDEAMARAKTASPAEKPLLEKLASWGWGPVQMYFRLSARELAALRAGQNLKLSADPKPDEQPLPPDVARGVLQSMRDTRLIKQENGYTFSSIRDATFAGALPPSTVPEARAYVDLTVRQSELGQFTLGGGSGFSVVGTSFSIVGTSGTRMFRLGGNSPYAIGLSPTVLKPDNRSANARFARDPALRPRVSVRPKPSCGPGPSPLRGSDQLPLSASGRGSGGGVNAPKVTTADVLEALHQASSLPIVADYYTALYPQGTVSVQGQPLFDTLNQIADSTRLRWTKEGSWLQFRSTSYYDDRLKEVPNRLLTRWAASQREHGALSLDEVIEIAQLTDAQLDGAAVAEGARSCYGLIEWNLARDGFFRPQLRYLAQLTPAQRQEAQRATGLAFTRMSLSQQQQFITMAVGKDTDRLRSLEDLAEASMRVGYTQPGEFQWEVPDAALDLPGRGTIGLSPVREPTRAAALQAARRIDPQAGEAQIVPTELAVTVVYTLGSPRTGVTAFARQATPDNARGWVHRFSSDRAGGGSRTTP